MLNNVYINSLMFKNGSKGPNIIGKDVFMLKRVDGRIEPYGYDYTTENVTRNCKYNMLYSTCAEKIRRDGWTIAKDYPW